jgi:hypothetical protein
MMPLRSMNETNVEMYLGGLGDGGKDLEGSRKVRSVVGFQSLCPGFQLGFEGHDSVVVSYRSVLPPMYRLSIRFNPVKCNPSDIVRRLFCRENVVMMWWSSRNKSSNLYVVIAEGEGEVVVSDRSPSDVRVDAISAPPKGVQAKAIQVMNSAVSCSRQRIEDRRME